MLSFVCGLHQNLLLLYGALLVTGIFFLKRYYCDNEGVSALAGGAYIVLFGLYISRILLLIGADPLNLPFLVILSTPVLTVFAIFFSNFFTQIITIGEFLHGNVKFQIIDHIAAAMTCLKNQDYRKAIEAYRRFLDIHPEDFQIHMEIAEIHALYLSEYLPAIREYELALQKSGKSLHSIAILNRMADIYFSRLNRPDVAADLLLKITRNWPGTEAAQRASERISGLRGAPELQEA